MKKNIIFASMVAAIMFANVTAKAETVSTIKLDSNKSKSTNDYNKLLVNGQENELKSFINENSPALATKNETILVNKVLSLYNNNSSAFFNMTDAQKAEFNKAVIVFVKNLETIKTKEANNWLLKVKYTANTINFLWSVNQIEVLDINNDTNIDSEVTAI
jgi:cyclophilin family peptidyl-prolyl cis-trans isomerase